MLQSSKRCRGTDIKEMDKRKDKTRQNQIIGDFSCDIGVADALAEIKANRTSRNGDDSHNLGTGRRRTERAARESTAPSRARSSLLPALFLAGSDVVEFLPQDYWSLCCIRNAMENIEKDDDSQILPKRRELALMCSRMFPEESDEVEKYIHSIADRQAENKRKLDETSMNNQNQQQPFKRYNVARAYTTGPGENKVYGGSKPLYPKCNYHHEGQYAPRCNKCKKGHYKTECPKLKNKNQRNQVGNGNVVVRAYAIGTVGTNPNSNVVTDTFLLNNLYALILLDTSADRSFLSIAFSSLIDIVPTTLDHGYDVELADSIIIEVNTLIRGCTLNFLNHPFNIDLIPIELGIFNVVIGMD
ncbi:hypothetical protein Tco_1118913 [Tanacetum coccineum]